MTIDQSASHLTLRNAAILRHLRTAAGIVGIASMASVLGVDKNTVVERVTALTDLGYPILFHKDGFQLTSDCDFLFPWEFGGREERIHYYQEIDSTMTAARKMAQAGCPPFTVVLAEHQTSGHGRLNRTWHSAKGGLYFTLVLRPSLRPEDSGQLNFLTSVVLAGVLQDHCGITAGVKWPNDILVGDRKIAGILSEQETRGTRVHYVNIGIGLNVNNDPRPVEPGATSLKELLGKQILRAPLLSRFLDELERNVKKMSWEETLQAWRKRTVTLNRQVRIVTSQDTTEGVAIDVDNTGALIVQLANGTLKQIVYGDCFIRP